jgi:RNA recognition motif-containing protein
VFIPVEPTRAEITFADEKLTKQALLLNGVFVGNCKLAVKLAPPKIREAPQPVKSTMKKDQTTGQLQNLYVNNLPKSLDEQTVRRVFARFGKICSMKLVDKSQFKTNVAYVGYFCHAHAARAIKNATKESELMDAYAISEASTPVSFASKRIKHEGSSKSTRRLVEPETVRSVVQVNWLTTKEQREQIS